MTTRCSITIKQGEQSYRIYRHADGYPEGVLSDIKVVLYLTDRGRFDGLNDAEYFLANLIFYAKVSFYERYRFKGVGSWIWECGYGVCNPNCEHGDLDYKYLIDADTNTITIYKFDYSDNTFVEIFNGTLGEAFEKYTKGYEGCHVDAELIKSLAIKTK